MSPLPRPTSRRRAPFQCLCLEGVGGPESPQFQSAIWALTSVGYAIAQTRQHAIDLTPLEGIWSARRKQWRWKLVLPVPDSVTDGVVDAAKFGAGLKNPNPAIPAVSLTQLLEREVFHLMEVEAWDQEWVAPAK